MTISKAICAAALCAALSASPAAAQAVPVDANVDSRALVLIPLTLTKVDDLDFGDVVTSSDPGTVTISAATGARTFSGGVSGLASDSGNRAYFAGAGAANQQVLVAVSPPTELTSVDGDTIPVMGLTLDGPPMRTINATSRTFFVGIGGSLQIAADQAPGDYSADFWVTAIYQ